VSHDPPHRVCQEAGYNPSGLRIPFGDAPNDGLRAEELNPDLAVQRIGSKSKERVMAGAGSEALKALVAAIQPGVDPNKVSAIAGAYRTKNPPVAMKKALADILNISPEDVDTNDANMVLQITKASIPSGGLVPMY